MSKVIGMNLIFNRQLVEYDGQNQVLASQPLCRQTRIESKIDLAGTIYAYESGQSVTSGIPQDAGKIHNLATGYPYNQSEKAETSISYRDYYLMDFLYASVNKTQDRTVDFVFQKRQIGDPFRSPARPWTLKSTGTTFTSLPFHHIVQENSDCRMLSASNNTATGVRGGFSGDLAEIVTSLSA